MRGTLERSGRVQAEAVRIENERERQHGVFVATEARVLRRGRYLLKELTSAEFGEYNIQGEVGKQ